MNYKYYIYQGSALSTFDKYDLNDYTLIREITNNGKWTLKTGRDGEFFTVIRTKLSGDITVKGDDFNALIALEESHVQYAILITRECSGTYTELWRGFFSYFDFKVDLDKCYLTFEPEVWDEYSPIFDQLPIERNVLAAAGPEDVFVDSFTYETESIVETVALFPPHVDAVYQEYGSFALPVHDSLPVPNKYYLFSVVSLNIGDGFYYNVTRTFKREWALANSDVVPPPGFVDNGEVIPDEYLPGIWKWVRPIGDMDTTTYTHVEDDDGNIYEELELPLASTDVLHGCITLRSVLEYFATFFNLTYVSNFFNNTPCPMGNTSLYLTMIQQISNIRDTSDVAVRGIMKLKDLLTWIRDTFNVYWYIDANGDFRLEHRRYFDSGLSYPYAAAITQDLNALYPVNLTKMNRYEWGKPQLFRFEKLNIPYSYFSDWVDSGIEYPQLSILNNETFTVTVEWGTDVIAMLNYNDELPKQGWTLLNVDWVDFGGGILAKKVINTTGALSGTPIQNARFSAANLLRDLWTWGRLLPSGKINGFNTTFNSIQRLKKQVEVNIPQCCQDLDYNGLFRTELGDGILSEAEYEMNGNLKMNLIYE